jgi:hypothetical protein
MTDVKEKLEVVREAGELGLELLECDTPPVSRYTPEGDDGVPIFQEDERFWDAWIRVRDLVAEFDEDAEVNEERGDTIPYLAIDARRQVGGERFALVSFVYGADGGGTLTIQFQIEDGHRTISEYKEKLTALDLGREIAATEITLLANELQSPAETLDYWMTQTFSSTRQSSWADDRKASPQTVSDRVRSAKEKLDYEEA